MKVSAILFVLSSSVTFVYSLSLPSISDCPALPKRPLSTSVLDLRADDIKVIVALGDSVTAGLAADPDAQSLANYLKHYREDLIGASVGVDEARYCPATFFCLDPLHHPSVDHLNAAQTGATTAGLPDQVNYVLKYIGPRTRLINEWKMINLYIGYNDISSFCLPGMSPEHYGNEIYNNLKRLIDNTDNAFINVLTIERYDQLLMKVNEHPDYVKQFADKMNIRNYECVCCANGGIEKIGAQVELYNAQLEIAVDRIKQYIDGTIVDQLLGLNRRNKIAIVLQPLDMNTATVPYDATR
ncbi:hypothetical protein RO3G_07563 [Rhizopus delemar RA 99-880]|uniref:SGNH hydrolase-type esterase domain-containing protein n=1 Tax=Rhizopus delemar (strain RA 99-880 / ATCC MYA-4621 / FGSC 9543 / NRRL 43880) TaxID=246409 RepID=I1C328_RHIO9|nr:hypothetical protein RO3G_07563 [Rhizopus delemar RA 99-880]|eukprot:EIE82858.1 hypothetical protein RO3G_07563 [Rhizopus delemar RA 99-880]